jgi:hypothetical protein
LKFRKEEKMPYVSVDVYVDARDVLDQLDTEDLIEELKRRGENPTHLQDSFISETDMRELMEKIWHNRRNGKPFDAELDQLIYGVLDKVI